MDLIIPGSIEQEHVELHQQLEELTALEGKTGKKAKRVAELLDPHFEKEEELALPQLGLLVELSNGNIPEEIDRILVMSEKLKRELPRMLEEHKEITAALEELKDVAEEEDNKEAIEFADKLILHAKTEEEVMYPAAVLIGEFLKQKKEADAINYIE